MPEDEPYEGPPDGGDLDNGDHQRDQGGHGQ